mmetsp:Transcript_72531/g.201148  ORF Transcript_72531/g.201148 Transcript_72531/m.201148 type:complete len:218 (-) Transcript_72531:1205-1858(-)
MDAAANTRLSAIRACCPLVASGAAVNAATSLVGRRPRRCWCRWRRRWRGPLLSGAGAAAELRSLAARRSVVSGGAAASNLETFHADSPVLADGSPLAAVAPECLRCCRSSRQRRHRHRRRRCCALRRHRCCKRRCCKRRRCRRRLSVVVRRRYQRSHSARCLCRNPRLSTVTASSSGILVDGCGCCTSLVAAHDVGPRVPDIGGPRGAAGRRKAHWG